ncbi:hypothetical protein LPJ73_006908, partial [Coemansia sp. RSA 2703]
PDEAEPAADEVAVAEKVEGEVVADGQQQQKADVNAETVDAKAEAENTESEAVSGAADVDAVKAEAEAEMEPEAVKAEVESVGVEAENVREDTAPALHKTDSTVRRRARPPPPPPAPAGSRARSVRQQSQASLRTTTTTAAAAVPAAVPAAGDAVVPLASEPEPPAPLPPAAGGDAEARVVPRGRRQASSGPVAITMHVSETLDFTFRHPHDAHGTSDVDFTSLVTGSITMRIAQAINPLELAPLRISVQAKNVQLVANPSVVVADGSLTTGLNDGCTWYRFVRPNLFAQGAADVPVFKYQVQGTDMHIMPMHIHQGNLCEANTCAIMLFCEPHPKGPFAGDTLVAPAVLLNIEGSKIAAQSSRPAAVWYGERNSVMWRLDDMLVPGDQEETRVQEAARSLTIKASGDGWPVPGPIALKFEAHATRLVDVAVAIARVSAGGAPVALVDSPKSHVVKSGKCVYVYENAPGVEEHGVGRGRDDGASSSATSEAEWSAAEDQSHQQLQQQPA